METPEFELRNAGFGVTEGAKRPKSEHYRRGLRFIISQYNPYILRGILDANAQMAKNQTDSGSLRSHYPRHLFATTAACAPSFTIESVKPRAKPGEQLPVVQRFNLLAAATGLQEEQGESSALSGCAGAKQHHRSPVRSFLRCSCQTVRFRKSEPRQPIK